MFTDVDDLLQADAVEKNVRIAEESDADVLMFGFWYYDVANDRKVTRPMKTSFCGSREEDVYKRQEYDCIFVDLPPAGIVADALVLAATATAYILVVREGVTKFDREQMIVQMLEPVGANICGFVFNGISMKSQDYHYKHYAKDYKY